MNTPQIGARIRRRRAELGMSLDTLAAKTNLNRTTLWRIETGQLKTPPRIPTVYAIAKALDLDPVELAEPERAVA